MWLWRFIERVLDRPGVKPGEGERAIVELLDRRSLYTTAELLARLLALLPTTPPLDERILARLVRVLRGAGGDSGGDIATDHTAQIEFWRALGLRIPADAYVRACYGDELLAAEQPAAALGEFLAAFTLDPALVGEFGEEVGEVARELGGATWLRYQLCQLRCDIENDSDDEEACEAVRERYSELLEEHQDDAEAVGLIRALGRRIDEMIAAEMLPRTLVRRGRWRERQ